MKKLLSILGGLTLIGALVWTVSGFGPIGSLGGGENLFLGGRQTFAVPTPQPTGQTLLRMICSTSGSTKHCSFRDSSGSTNAGRAVTANKTLMVTHLDVCNGTSGAGIGVQLLSSSNDVGWNTTNSFTGALYEGGSDTSTLWQYQSGTANSGTVSGDTCQHYALNFQVSSGAYLSVSGNTPSASGSNTAYVIAWGYEF